MIATVSELACNAHPTSIPLFQLGFSHKVVSHRTPGLCPHSSFRLAGPPHSPTPPPDERLLTFQDFDQGSLLLRKSFLTTTFRKVIPLAKAPPDLSPPPPWSL